MKKKLVSPNHQIAENIIDIIRNIFEEAIPEIEKSVSKLSDDHSPSNAKGTLRSINLVTDIRRRLCEEYNWKSDNKNGSSLSISPDRKIAFMIRTGNSYVGNPNVPDHLPKTNDKRISKRSKAICIGQEKLRLDGSTEFLLLLHRKSKDGQIMHAEISKVSELDGQNIISLTDRYCFSVDLSTGNVERTEKNIPEQEDFIVEEFSIKRK